MLIPINHIEETVEQLPQIFLTNAPKKNNSNIDPETTNQNSPFSISDVLDSEEGQTELTQH